MSESSKKRERRKPQAWADLQAKNVQLEKVVERLERACRAFKAREGRLTVALFAIKVAQKKNDTIAVSKFLGDMVRDFDLLAQCAAVMGERDLAMKAAYEALKKIAASAPCKEGHESFNTPGQPCDQRLAEDALKVLRQLDPYFLATYEELSGSPAKSEQETPPAPAASATA